MGQNIVNVNCTLQNVCIAVPQRKCPWLSLLALHTIAICFTAPCITDFLGLTLCYHVGLLRQHCRLSICCYFGWVWQIWIWDKQTCLGLHPNFRFSCHCTMFTICCILEVLPIWISFSKAGEYLLLISGTESDGEDLYQMYQIMFCSELEAISHLCVWPSD